MAQRTTSGLQPVVERSDFNRDIDVYSEDNKFSVYNMITPQAKYFRDMMQKVPEEFRDRDQFGFRDEIDPTPTMNALRINFWFEYDQALEKKRNMRIQHIVSGICTVNTFKNMLKDDVKTLAWILTPVQSYQIGMQDLLETCLYKMRKAVDKLSMSDTKDLSTVMRVYEAFDKRMHGDYTQKVIEKKEITVENKTKNKEVEFQEMEKLGINNNVIEVKNDKEER